MDSLLSVATLSILGLPLGISLAGLLGLKDNPKLMRRLSVGGAALSFGSAVLVAFGVLNYGPVDRVFGIVGDPALFHFSVGVWIDRLSLLSLLLITSIGLIVQKYSVRYLEGDENQGRFFTWLSFVLFAVSLFVISRTCWR